MLMCLSPRDILSLTSPFSTTSISLGSIIPFEE
jgi:hypothetical protein